MITILIYQLIILEMRYIGEVGVCSVYMFIRSNNKQGKVQIYLDSIIVGAIYIQCKIRRKLKLLY